MPSPPDPLSRKRGEGGIASVVLPSPAAVGEGLGVRACLWIYQSNELLHLIHMFYALCSML